MTIVGHVKMQGEERVARVVMSRAEFSFMSFPCARLVGENCYELLQPWMTGAPGDRMRVFFRKDRMVEIEIQKEREK